MPARKTRCSHVQAPSRRRIVSQWWMCLSHREVRTLHSNRGRNDGGRSVRAHCGDAAHGARVGGDAGTV